MRRWLRVLVVGVLTVLLSIDSASACRLFRSRCRPRCRVATCHPRQTVVSVVSVESLPQQCCVPADGSAHAVIVETEQTVVVPSETPSVPAPAPAAPVAVDAPRPSAPKPVSEPLEPLTPIAPASAEKPLPPAPPAATEPAPVPQPQFKTAAEILAESAEKERLEKAAAEAAKPAAPAAEPPMKEAPTEPAPEKSAPAPAPEEPETPAEPAPKKPAPKPAAENFFDEDGDAPEEEPASEDRAPMKKNEPAKESSEDLFDEPEAETPSADAAPAPAEEPAAEAPSEEESEEESEKTEDDPFALLDANPEPVRRWIDSSGRHETIGRLVEVHPDRVRILKRNGRYTTVPMHLLSLHDQAYATAVGERLAGQSPARPAVTDTAHR